MESNRLKGGYVASALVMAALLVTVTTFPFRPVDAQVLPGTDGGGTLGDRVTNATEGGVGSGPLAGAANMTAGGGGGRLGDHITEAGNQKIEELRANNPELGTLADKLQEMNVQDAVENLLAVVQFTETMMTALSNLQGNTTGGVLSGNMTSTQ